MCFLWPQHSPTQNQGGVLSGPGWRSLSWGSGPVMTKVRAHLGIREQGEAACWFLPGQTQPKRLSQAVQLGIHRLPLGSWAGAEALVMPRLWSTIRCVLRGGDPPPPPNILPPDDLSTRTLHPPCTGCAPVSGVYRGKWCRSEPLSSGFAGQLTTRKNNQKPSTVLISSYLCVVTACGVGKKFIATCLASRRSRL